MSNKFLNFITNTMKNWKVEMTVAGKPLAEVKIQTVILQEDSLWPMLCVIVIMTFNYTLRKRIETYKFTELQDEINHFIYIDDMQVSEKKNKKNKRPW